MQRVLDIVPEPAGMLALLPQSTLGFSRQNTLDLKLYDDSLLESEELSPENLTAVTPFMQETLGASIEELMDAFGPQWGMALKDIKTGGFFPIPELGIYIQSQRPEIIQWGSSMAAMIQPDKAAQIAPFADQVINPLLDGLKMYKTIPNTTHETPNT